jgi:hypothetical protein
LSSPSSRAAARFWVMRNMALSIARGVDRGAPSVNEAAVR